MMDKLPPEIKCHDSAIDINASTSIRSKTKISNKECIIDTNSTTSNRKRSKVTKEECTDDRHNTIKKSRKSRSIKVTDELRRLVIVALEAGTCSRKTAATTFNLPYPTIIKIYKKFLDTGEIEGKPREVKSNELQNEHIQFILNTLADNCTYTLKELAELTMNKFAIKIPSGTIANTIPTFHYSLKRVQEVAVAGLTPDIINDHKEYCELFLQLKDSGRLLIYFDETEFQVTMRRFPERDPLGQQILGVPPPSTRIRKKTVMASITQDELLYYKAFDGIGSCVRIMEYLTVLFDLLSDRGVTGAVLIMGNAAFTYCQEIAEATQLGGHEVIFLPACSPFLNPVENMFSQWIHFIRSNNPPNEKELEDLIASFDGLISVEHCQYYCSHTIDNATSCVNRKLIYTK